MKIMNKKLLLLYMSLYPCITNANVYMCLRCPVGTYGDGKSSYCSPCPKIDGAHYLEDSKNCEWECDEGKVVVAKYANGGGCCTEPAKPKCPAVKVYVFGGTGMPTTGYQGRYSKTLECGESFQNDGVATNTPNSSYECTTMGCIDGVVKNINGEMWCYKSDWEMKKNIKGRHYDMSGYAKCLKE